MIYHTLLTCSLAVLLVNGQRYAKYIDAQPRMGYSTSVVHSYPNFNDLQAESSIDVNMQTQLKNRGRTKYTQTISNLPNSHLFPQEEKKSNLFNVGYNLSFNENRFNPRKKEQRYVQTNNKKFENAEVITGKLKKNEKVRAPNLNAELSPQDFVSNAVLKQKQLLSSSSARHTFFPANSKLTNVQHIVPEREEMSKYPSQSSTFTYNTQQNIFKDVIKATRPDPIQLSPDFETSFETSGRWKNINEQGHDNPSRTKYTTTATQIQPKFNHETALRNSESFDFSNAHGEIKFGDTADNSQEGSEQHSVKAYEPPINFHNNNINGNVGSQQATEINNLNIEAHIPKNLRGVKPLPLDTSLLKEPVLTTTFKDSPKYGRVIPIHFDVRSIQTAMQQAQNFHVPQQGQNYRYPPLTNYGQTLDSQYEQQESSPSQKEFRIYGKPEPVDPEKYEFNSNYEEDVYKIVSMRPPPIPQNLRY